MSQGHPGGPPKGKGATVVMSQVPQAGAPPPAQGGHEPPAPYGGAPPQAPYGAPPQQGFGGPPQQGYGPPPQQGYGAPQQGFGGPGGPLAVAGGGGAIPAYVAGEKTQFLGLDQNLAAAVGYFVPLLALLLLFQEPKQNQFVRFHALQELLFGVIMGVLGAMLAVVAAVLVMFVLPDSLAFLGSLTMLPLLFAPIAALIAAFKAYQGQPWKIPVIGGFAEKFALKA